MIEKVAVSQAFRAAFQGLRGDVCGRGGFEQGYPDAEYE